MPQESANRSISICHVTSAHSRYDVRIFEKECKSLARNGHKVTLLVNDELEDESIDNVYIKSTRFMPKNRVERMLLSQKTIKKLAIEIDADVYHFHDPELLPLGNKLKRIGKKVIFDSHENYVMQIKEKYYIPSLLRQLISKIYYYYETYSVKKIDAVILPCTFNNINPFENRAKRTVFINNVPILEEFYDKYNEKLIKEEKKICYVGSLARKRGISEIIKAADQAKVTLVLGGNLLPKEYCEEVINMPEFSSVDYRGYVNREEVVKIYEECSVGVSIIQNVGQYNKVDNLATKVYEYMSMGLPVIISNYPYANKVLQHYNFGVSVDPSNINQIVDAINYILNNPDKARIMGKNGREAIKKEFNWNIQEKKLIELYDVITSKEI